MTKAERSVSKQGHLQPRCHSKARSPSRDLLRGEKLNYKSVAKETSKPPFLWLLKSSGHQSLPCLFDSRFL